MSGKYTTGQNECRCTNQHLEHELENALKHLQKAQSHVVKSMRLPLSDLYLKVETLELELQNIIEDTEQELEKVRIAIAKADDEATRDIYGEKVNGK